MKILYVTTISNTVNGFLIPHIRMLINEGHEVHCAINIVQEVNEELINLGCKIHEIEFQRSPLSKENIKAYKKLKRLIKQEKYDLVHTHTPVASACVRLACRNLTNTRVFYTAHGFVHISPGAHLAGTVKVGQGSWLGIGSVVSNNLKITNGCTIGAGAVVVKDLPENCTAVGCPAKPIKFH